MRSETLGPIELSTNDRLVQDLRQAGVLTPSQEVSEISRFYDSGMRAESWMYGYEVSTTTLFSEPTSVRILERNVISTAGGLTHKAEAFLLKLHSLARIGIPIPRTYGRVRASLYHEFIDGECAGSKIASMQQGDFDEDLSDIGQLADIAKKLDQNGFAIDDFLRDLVYDPERKLFLYSDAGYDFGTRSSKPVTNNSTQLRKRFTKHRDIVEDLLLQVKSAS